MKNKKETKDKVDELRDLLHGKKESDAKKNEKMQKNPSLAIDNDQVDLEGFNSLQEKIEALENEIKKKQKEAQVNHEQMLRAVAESENFKKRSSRELEKRAEYANEKIISELLAVLDHLDLAIKNIPESSVEEVKSLAQGVELAQKEFLTILQRYGVERLESVGSPFNPHFHEAMAQVEVEEVASGTVVEEFRRGYKLKERLLRASLVNVAK